jgi:uncharacterized membrane protein
MKFAKNPKDVAGKGSLDPRSRLASVDLMRGLVMVLMALDHTRDFFTDADFDPTDLGRTNAALFFTRWITHFCAPVFFLLAGLGAHLATLRGRTTGNLSLHLCLRGLWLIVLEMSVVNFAWSFTLPSHHIALGVLWALGWSMVVLGLMVHWPRWLIATFGVALVTGHNLLDGVQAAALHLPDWLWTILHSPGHVRITESLSIDPYYALVPWVGVTAVGYAFGPRLLRMLRERPTAVLGLSLLVTAAFVVLRLTDVYGDPHPWSVREDALGTLMSFLNTTKYPPSLLYLLMTLGPTLGLLAIFERLSGPAADFLIAFGRVPLFYYILHLYLLHALAVGAGFVTGHDAAAFISSFWRFPQDYGFGLAVVYLVWMAVVLMLYPVCARFGRLKARRRFKILSYL